MRAISALSVAALVLSGILSVSLAGAECVCDEEPALEIQSISSSPSQRNTVQVFLQVQLQNSTQCICCQNVSVGYRYCAWSKGSLVPENITSLTSSDNLPWNLWIDENPLCFKKPFTISITNLSDSHFFKFQVAPLSTKLGPITKLNYFGSQVSPVIKKIEPLMRVRVNDTFSITCNATGSPAPEVYWSTFPLSTCSYALENQIDNVLRFEHIQPYQACKYTCFARNWRLKNGTPEPVTEHMNVRIQVIGVDPSSSTSSSTSSMPVLTATIVTSTLTNRTQVASAPPTEEMLIQALIPAATIFAIVIVLCLLGIPFILYLKKNSKTRSMTTLNCSRLRDLPFHIPIVVNNDYYFHSYVGEYSDKIRLIPIENLQVMGTIGEGKFATVCCAWAKDIPCVGQQTMVAVKKLKPDASLSGEVLKTLCHEARLMCRLEHKHVVKFYGMHVSHNDSVPTMLIYEYMEEGDLRTFLLRKAEVKHTSGTAPRQRSLSTSSGYDCQTAGLSTVQLLDICLQVAQGMQYLVEQLKVHRDLAARNCLVGKNLLVKISDLGMGQSLYGKNYYRVDRQGYVPVKWMSPEALLNGIFSQYSDVWAFGVLMWEVFTFGQEPYPGKSCDEVVLLLQGQNAKSVSVSLAQPRLCPGSVYSIMRHCWSMQKERRPSFRSLVDELNYWLINKQWSGMDFETTV